jgi:Uncharacterized conserved protein
MKRLLLLFSLLLLLASCGNTNQGELVGVRKSTKPFSQPDPYGMVFIPQGSFTMGVGGEDITSSMLYEPKTVSVSSFYMDETEITNNEYRQFVYWVRDSIARKMLAEAFPDKYAISETTYGEPIDPPQLNWKEAIDWNSKDQEVREVLEPMYLPEHERFFRVKEIDSRKLFYSYFWIDLQAAAKKEYANGNLVQNDQSIGEADNGINPDRKGTWANRSQGYTDRSVYVRSEVINVYPDTLCWIHDYSYSFNDPMTEKYFWHPAYDHYPVVGVSWQQARAFCVWRSQLINEYMQSRKDAIVPEFRLPTETEWEWAARGGDRLNPYPWGGPYTRNAKGCFLANFKPLRGNYLGDGGLRTLIVGCYPANNFGLYDMAGNVAEWTNSAFDPNSYNFTWDLNPDYTYNAKEDDPPVMKRKVIRGGSWKDISYYIQVTARDYEYQDTAKSYIGFRTIQPFMGRNKGDNTKLSRVYR